MDIRQTFRTAIRMLMLNKMRFGQVVSILSIGIMGVIITLIFSLGLIHNIESLYKQYSPSLMFVDIMIRAEAAGTVTREDMELLAKDNLEIIQSVNPVVYVLGGIRYGERLYEDKAIIGTGTSFLSAVTALHLNEGRWLLDMDIERRQNVCVVGCNIANEIMCGNAIGSTLKIHGENYTVVGVLDKIPNYDKDDWNETVFIPYTNADILDGGYLVDTQAGKFYENKYWVNATNEDNMQVANRLIRALVKDKIGSAHITYVKSFHYMEKQGMQAVWTTTVPLLVLACIVLLVGGVCIMNVMLLAVSTRTKEIGIRKAFGATNRDIKYQFQLEAVIISIVGSALGIVLALVISVIGSSFFGSISFDNNVHYSLIFSNMDMFVVPVLAALIISVCIGVISASYPAQQAAKIEPVSAINSD